MVFKLVTKVWYLNWLVKRGIQSIENRYSEQCLRIDRGARGGILDQKLIK